MEANLSDSNVAEPELELVEDGDDQGQQSGQPAAAQAVKPAPDPPWRASKRRHVPERRACDGEVDEDGHRVILVDGESFTVVEGDLVLDIDQKGLWQEALNGRKAAFESQASIEAAGLGELELSHASTGRSTLVGIVQAGKLVRWSPNTILSYCVLQHTFPRQEWYEEVVANMRSATQAWEAICGVRFEYVPDQDTSGSVRPDGVLFPVRYIGAGGAFIAAAFFPNDPASRRRVLIDPSYFTTSFNHVGVLRHELGHVLGFRHEHIRSGAPAVCPHEDTSGTINLTNYDPQSVMHYFCGGVGSRKLELTQVDSMGAQNLYGPPLGSFELIEA